MSRKNILTNFFHILFFFVIGCAMPSFGWSEAKDVDLRGDREQFGLPPITHSRVNQHLQQNDLASAVKFAEELVEIAKEENGSEHPSVAWTLAQLGEIYIRQERYEEAEKCFQEAKAVFKKNPATFKMKSAMLLNGIGQTREGRGHVEEAENYYWKATALFEEVGHGPNQALKESVKNLELFYGKIGKSQQAAFVTRYLQFIEASLDANKAAVFKDQYLDKVILKAVISPKEPFQDRGAYVDYFIYSRGDLVFDGFSENPTASGMRLEWSEKPYESTTSTVKIKGKRYVKLKILTGILSADSPGEKYFEPGTMNIVLKIPEIETDDNEKSNLFPADIKVYIPKEKKRVLIEIKPITLKFLPPEIDPEIRKIFEQYTYWIQREETLLALSVAYYALALSEKKFNAPHVAQALANHYVADAYARINAFLFAERYYQQSEDTYLKIGDFTHIHRIVRLAADFGGFYLSYGKISKSRKKFKRIINLINNYPKFECSFMGKLWEGLGATSLFKLRFSQAKIFYRKALGVIENTGEDYLGQRENCMIGLGDAERGLTHVLKAKKIYEDTVTALLQRADSLNDKLKPILAAAKIRLADIAMIEGEFENSRKYLSHADKLMGKVRSTPFFDIYRDEAAANQAWGDGNKKKAKKMLKNILAQIPEGSDFSPSKTLEIAFKLSQMLLEDNEADEAIPYFKRALKEIERIGKPMPYNRCACDYYLGVCYYDKEAFRRARIQFRKAFESCQGWPEANKYKAYAAYYLGEVERNAENFNEAEANYLKAIKLAKSSYGAKSEALRDFAMDFGGMYKEWRKYEKAEQYYKQVIALDIKNYGDRSAEVADDWNAMGLLLDLAKKFVEAEMAFKKSIAIKESLIVPHQIGIAYSLYNLAQVYENRGEFEFVQGLYERALVIEEKMLGNEHEDTRQVRKSLEVLRKRG